MQNTLIAKHAYLRTNNNSNNNKTIKMYTSSKLHYYIIFQNILAKSRFPVQALLFISYCFPACLHFFCLLSLICTILLSILLLINFTKGVTDNFKNRTITESETHTDTNIYRHFWQTIFYTGSSCINQSQNLLTILAKNTFSHGEFISINQNSKFESQFLNSSKVSL